MEVINMTENERIKEVRTSLDMTLEKFGDRLGVTKVAVSNIERGNRNVTDQMRKAICREFDVNEEWLRTGEGSMFIELSEQEKVMKYTGLLLKDEDSAVANAIQALIVTYEQLDDTSKATLNKIIMQYMDNLKKSR